MIGTVVGNYEILSRLGAGGMGTVYLGRHKLIGRRAALKVLLPELSHNQEMVNRFFNEARSTAEIKHPGLIEIFDFGWHQGCAYLAMELLEGESLAAMLRRQPRPPIELVAAVGRQVATALGAAHSAGIVHRDLKPDNVFLCPDEEIASGVRAKVLDFGIAKLSANSQTRTGSLMGTPLYMSPEQCRGAGQVDQRSDIYSLGCLLYEMVAGRPPFVLEGMVEIIGAHMFQEPAALCTHAPDVPEWIEALIMRSLAKRPEERPQSMEELATALGRPSRGGGRPSNPPFAGAVPGSLPPTVDPGPPAPSATTPTTLGGSVAEVVTPAAAPGRSARKRTGLIAAALVVGAGGAAAGVLLSRAGQGDEAPASPPSTLAASTPTSPASPASPPAPTVTAAPASQSPAPPVEVTVRIESEPRAWVVDGGHRLGETPFTLKRPRSSAAIALTLEKTGYDDEAVAITFETDGTVRVDLKKRAGSGRAKPSPTGPAYKDVKPKGWDD